MQIPAHETSGLLLAGVMPGRLIWYLTVKWAATSSAAPFTECAVKTNSAGRTILSIILPSEFICESDKDEIIAARESLGCMSNRLMESTVDWGMSSYVHLPMKTSGLMIKENLAESGRPVVRPIKETG